jgi:hypothetical protein
MRQVLSISLPGATIKEIKEKSKKRGFESVSKYIKFLVKEDDDLISVDEILGAAKRAEEEYKQGKLKKFTSLKDLMK